MSDLRKRRRRWQDNMMKDTTSLKSYSKAILIRKIIRTVVCILFCIFSLLPFIMLIMNITRDNETIQSGFSLIPGDSLLTNIKNFKKVSKGFDLTAMQAFINSMVVTCPATFFAVYFSSMTAYGIHVYNFKFKKVAWSFVLAVMMIPSQVTIIGFCQFMMKLNLDNTYIPLIFPAIAAPSVVFFMKQYMESTLSLEMIDASRIDGAGEFRTFNKIIMPIMKPAVATQAIFQFIANWNNLFTPTMLLTTESKKTMPLFVQLLNNDSVKSDYGVIYFGLFISIIPLLVMYLILSKFIIAGVALGGVKE